MPQDLSSTLVFQFLDPVNRISSAVISQVPGVGSGGSTYQATCDFTKSSSTDTGGFFVRFISNVDELTDTKSGIVTELGPEGWPQRLEVSQIENNDFTMTSNNTLLANGTPYRCGIFWAGPDYFAQLDALSGMGDVTAFNNLLTAADGAGQLWPSGDAVHWSNEITLSAFTTPATSIFAEFSVVTGASAGTLIGVAQADRSDGVFSEIPPTLDWLSVAADGSMSITAGFSAPAPGVYTIGLRYDNTAVTGGDVYDQVVNTITVTEQTAGQTPGYIPAPIQNTNSLGRFTTASELAVAMATLQSNWVSAMASYGLSSTGTEPVFTLAAGSHGSVLWSFDFSGRETVHIRGEGPFTRNEYRPIGGTKFTRMRWDNCNNVQMWLMDIKPNTVSTTRNADNHWMRNSVNCRWNRCAVGGDIAETPAAMEARVKDGTYFLMDVRGSNNCGFYNCTFIGARSGFFGCAGNDAYDAEFITIEGCVFDQLSNDFFQLYGDHGLRNWRSINNVGFGVCRFPSNLHTDYWQSADTGGGQNPDASGWIHRGNWMQECGYTGNDGSIATKGLHNKGTGVPLAFTFDDCAFFLSGNGISGGGFGGGSSSVDYCTFLAPTDVSGNQDNEPAPSDGSFDVIWTSAFTGFKGQPSINKDHNIIITNNGSTFVAANAGPNGLMIDHPGAVGTNYGVPGLGAGPGGQVSGKNNPPAPPGGYGYSGAYAGRLENFKDPDDMSNTVGREISALTTAVPRRGFHGTYNIAHAVGIEQWKPVKTSDIGWAPSVGQPIGAYKLMERMFDDINHDHPKDHGFPTAALFHLRFDRTNAAGGAVGNYDTFDANGD